MNLKEAQIYLNANDYSELASLVDEEVFKIKKYFFTTAFHPKLAQSKVQKLNKLLDIQNNALQMEPKESLTLILEAEEISSFKDCSPLECIVQYNQKRSELLIQLHRAEYIIEIIRCIQSKTKLFLNFASKWPPLNADFIEVKLTKEIDPIIFLKQLRLLDENGINSFEGLAGNQKLISSDLIHEFNRLNKIALEFDLGR
jgi:hypothetical protein